MHGDRIVMPESLWKHTILLAHEVHQRIVCTKAGCEKMYGGRMWITKYNSLLKPAIHAS